MADIVVTVASVGPVTDATKGITTQTVPGIAGSSMTAGQAAYLDQSSDPPTWALCLSTSQTKAAVGGINMNQCGSGEPCNIAVAGDIYIGASPALTVTNILTLGLAAGGIDVNAAQATTGWYPSLIGQMVGTTQCRLAITTAFQGGIASGVTATGTTRTAASSTGVDPITLQAANLATITNSANGKITQTIVGIAGAVITGGQVVYQSANNPSTYLQTAVTNANSAVVAGIACNNAQIGQEFTIAVAGDLNISPTNAVNTGDVVALGAAAGNMNTNQTGIAAAGLPALLGVMVTPSIIRLAVSTNNGVTHG